ncbi:MAG: Spy/CpxP family protein refolding chaperone [Gemmatimonadales bacterium]
MRRLGWVLTAVVLVAASPLRAQDSGDDSPQAARIRQQIEQRFAQQIQTNLGLTDEQAVKLRATFNTYAPKRRAMEQEERAIKRGLQGQLRPGIAANSDSVAKLVDRLLEIKVTYAQSFVDENREMSKYLTPVQRAQFQVMRERLMARIEEIRQQRQQQFRQQGAVGAQQP